MKSIEWNIFDMSTFALLHDQRGSIGRLPNFHSRYFWHNFYSNKPITIFNHIIHSVLCRFYALQPKWVCQHERVIAVGCNCRQQRWARGCSAQHKQTSVTINKGPRVLRPFSISPFNGPAHSLPVSAKKETVEVESALCMTPTVWMV